MIDYIDKEELVERNITSLFHFTQADNLENIFRYGLLSREELDKKRIYYSFNDETRSEGHINSISLSISFPNYKMFYRQRSKNKKVWAVLDINPYDILCSDEVQCAYYWTNAADKRMKSLSLRKLVLKETFEGLFGNWPLAIPRKDYEPEMRNTALDKSYPTNPQAEILVFSSIRSSSIQNIFFENEEDLNRYSKNIPMRLCKKNLEVFSPRLDWRDWVKEKPGSQEQLNYIQEGSRDKIREWNKLEEDIPF